jgi:uncharacterized protein YndB with AHSA1/START domain
MTVAPIHRSVHVAVPPQRAFDLFTGHMGRWWHAGHHIAPKPFTDILIEPGPGGRWYERDEDGAETQWGKVLEWNPPQRVLLAWQLNAEFAYDPDFLTELELAFEAEGGGTRVTLTHRDLHRFGDSAAKLQAGMDEGWGLLLGLYRTHANEEKAA